MNKKLKFPKNLLDPVEEFLTSKLNLLEARLNNINESDPFTNPERALDNSAMDTEAEEQFGHEMAAAQKDELQEKISQTKEAIERIKNGEYGYCKKCSKLINTDRLMIYPEATLCMDHAS